MARTSLCILWLCAKDRVHQEEEVSHLRVLSRRLHPWGVPLHRNKWFAVHGKHVKACEEMLGWGHIDKAYDAKTSEGAHEQLRGVDLKDGSITATFEWSGKGKVRYSHRQHTKADTKWVQGWSETTHWHVWIVGWKLFTGSQRANTHFKSWLIGDFRVWWKLVVLVTTYLCCQPWAKMWSSCLDVHVNTWLECWMWAQMIHGGH